MVEATLAWRLAFDGVMDTMWERAKRDGREERVRWNALAPWGFIREGSAEETYRMLSSDKTQVMSWVMWDPSDPETVPCILPQVLLEVTRATVDSVWSVD